MLEYRREIDGLRSIAVVSVVLFHAGWAALPGGYLGVDIFFVISGYLITSILLRELDEDRFSVVNFYERRFRRILPALFLVTMTSAIPAVFLLSPSQLAEYGRSLIATAVFVSNFLFAYEVDYFSNTAELKPLIHTWSLAVEEQFYIFFPPLLWWIYARGKNFIFAVLTTAILVSLLAAEFGAANFTGINFFLSHARIWELALGCLAAVVQFNHPQKGNNPVAALGMVMIIAPMFAYGENINSPTFFTAVPVAGAALVILYGRIDTWAGKMLATAPFVGIGLVSYSAYLWHQPLFAYARAHGNGHASAVIMGVMTVLTFVLAYLTWRFVENPPRKIRTGLLNKKWVFIWSALSIAITVLVGAAYAFQALKSRVEVNALLIDAVPEWQAAQNWYVENPSLADEWEAFSDPSKINVLVVGDSHSLGTFNMLYSQQLAGGLSDYQFIRVGLPMRCLETRGEGGSAQEVVDYCMNTLADRQRPDVFKDLDVVLYSIRWKFKDYAAEFVPQLVAWARARDIKTVMLSNTPEWKSGSPGIMRKIVDEYGRDNVTPAIINEAFVENHDDTVDRLNVLIEKLVVNAGALYLRKEDYACTAPGKCLAVSPDLEALHTDYGHMTRAGALYFGKRAVDMGWFDPVREFYAAPFDELPSASGEDTKDVLAQMDDVLGINRGEVLEGTAADDVLEGTDGDDTLRGMQGNDELIGKGGNDVIVGGNGNDILRSGGGRDRMLGGRGDDVFYLTSNVNIVRGDPGADLFIIDHERGSTTFIDFRPEQGDRIDVSSYMSADEFETLEITKKDHRNILYVSFKKRRFVFRNIPREDITADAFIFSDSATE